MIPDAWSALRGLSIRPAADAGLINTTLVAGDPPRFVVQRVHPVFAPEVHHDIEAITAHLATRGLTTPRLVRADDGALWARDESGGVWRVMDFIPGRTLHRVSSPALAREAAAFVARFHDALDDLTHDYRHIRPGAHDTPLHMERLRDIAFTDTPAPEGPPARDGAPAPDDARALAEAILDAWRTWHGRLDLPPRHCHGDLKISNLRFTEDDRALCLLDLDTLASYPLDVELGDAFRSWCNPTGEDVTDTQFDVPIFAAAVAGYTAVRPFTAEEREALGGAAERIALELAARFCRDAFDDRYFGWDPTRFPSRVAHNLHRARGQLSLALSARRQRPLLERALLEHPRR
ncbi:phosphotransferase enzyme family protein [Chondromyces apiculatus]|uniref:Aminoglycoside phosphotransferase domain-containing protein n=1 Tax=Chondromyces apiculatus DSM 436 TaxID=1192034 RepID=A0A017TCT1_9BACT|nr:phosphotransferase [Chondromyces apiculatus]EYF06737.1 Hypothetical protein CAP_1434 [Chondromyces apiculatus DSM 436]